MKECLSTEQIINSETKELIQQKIRLLTDFGFTWKEIAFLSNISKKTIKDFGLGKSSFPKDVKIELISSDLDKLIDRLGLNISNTTKYSDLCLEDVYRIKLNVQSVALYKGTGDDQIFIQIEGIKAINKSSV